jgi:phage-related minor tail protein
MDATGFVRGAQQMERAADQAATATQRINTATEKTRRTLNESGGAFERLRKSLDDAYRAQQEYERAQKTLNAGLERGKITQEQYNQLLEVTKQRFENTGASMDRLRAKYDQQFSAQQKLKQSMQEIATLEKAGALTAAAADRERATATQNYQRSIAAMRGVGPASAEVSRSLKLQAHEWTNLSYQAQDFIVQVGSGQGVFRPLLQQAPQAVGAVGGVGNAFRLLLSPVGLGAAALLAFGGTGAILMARLSDLRQEARSFGVALTANNTTIGTSVAQLQQYTRELERQGVEREKARSAILELARTPNISGQTREQIANLLPDFAAGRGVEMNDALKQLIELATGGREAVFKLQDQIGFMSIRQQESAQRFYEQGRSAEALRVVFDALQERFRGLREQELGPQAVAT